MSKGVTELEQQQQVAVLGVRHGLAGQRGARAQQSHTRAWMCGHPPDTPLRAQALKAILGGPRALLPWP